MNKLLLALCLSALALISFLFVRGTMSIRFDQNCGGYLKRAANAITVETAARELSRALEYADRAELTGGYTSVLWRTPDEDVGFWYRNLRDSLAELQSVKPDASPLERTNLLMKLRETLLDQGDNGPHLAAPPGLSAYPFNAVLAVFGWVSLLAFLAFLFATLDS